MIEIAMLILGIETSCDETSASIVKVEKTRIRVLNNIISSQIAKHAPFGGVVPFLAAREHISNLPHVLKSALGNLGMTEIDLIAVTSGPGLISSLLVGTSFARGLAYKYKKPIVGINHMEGHIYSNWLKQIGESSKFQIPNSKIFPALCLIVSGGHTQLVLMKDHGKYKLIGETLDDAAGEAFDKIARILGLGYPGGPAIELVASNWLLVTGKNKKISTSNQKPVANYQFPRPMIDSKDYNFSFAGLKTSVLYLVRGLLKKKRKEKLGTQTVANIAASAQAAIVDVLVRKTLRAAKQYEVKSIMLSGGVSANKLLRQKLQAEGQKLGLPVLIPSLEYTTDNAAMIALAGYFKVKNKKVKVKSLDWKNVKADANWEVF